MATKTAIAAKDRASRERIALEDRKEKKRQFEKSYKLEKEMQPYKKMQSAAGTTKDLFTAAYGKGGLASAMSDSNDPSWYKKFNLNEYSVKLPTFYRLGSELVPTWLNTTYNDDVPGINTLVFCPTLPNQLKTNVYGSKYYQVSPINQSLTRFMAELRKLNSRIGDYDPSDIGLYWYAIIGIILPLGSLQKALKGYNTYYAENNYLSRAFIKSCGFDPDDFYAHVQQYKAALIRYISIFNANAVIPDSLDLIKRYAWMSTVVVKEHKNMNAQLYHFRCGYSLTLTEDETYVSVSKIAALATYNGYVNDMDARIQNLFNSVGVVTMTADLRSAFPDNKLLKWPEFKGIEQLSYSESDHDLEQIHNARTLPSAPDVNEFGDGTFNPTLLSRTNIIVDKSGYLAQGAFDSSDELLPIIYKQNVSFSSKNIDMLGISTNVDNQFLNFYDSDMISDDSILEASRFRYSMFYYNATWDGHAFREIGTEIITHIEMMAGRTDSPDPDILNIYTNYYTTGFGLTSSELYTLALYTSFDWAPWIRFVFTDDSDAVNTVGEIDHAVYIANDNLRIIHEGCAFSLFYVDTFSSARVA